MSKGKINELVTVVIGLALLSACTSKTDYKTIHTENKKLKDEMIIVKAQLADYKTKIEEFKEHNDKLETKLELLKEENGQRTNHSLKPDLNDIKSNELRKLLFNIPHITYPIEVDKYVAQYFDKDSTNYKDTSFVYYSSLKEKVRYGKEVIAYESSSFEIDSFSQPKNIKLEAMFQGRFFKLPLAYAVSKEYLMILFLHTPTDEYSSATISAVYYKKDGELIHHDNKYSDAEDYFIECFCTSKVDLTIITFKTVLESDNQLIVERTALTHERELQEWLREDDPDSEIDLEAIPELVFEKRVMKIIISSNSETQQIVLNEEKIEFP